MFLKPSKILVLIATLCIIPSMNATVSVSKRKFFSPGGTAPVGTHQLSSFKDGNGENSQFYALESVGSSETRSGKIYWSAPSVDLRGYGPSISGWSINFDKHGNLARSGDFVAINYLSRKYEDLVILTNDGNGYFRRFKGYDNDKVLEAAKEKIKKKAAELGVPEANLNIWGEWNYATRLEQKWTGPNTPPEWVTPEQSYPGDGLLRIRWQEADGQTPAKYEVEQTAYKVGATYYVSDTTDENLSASIEASTLVVFTIDPNKPAGQTISVQVGEPILSIDQGEKEKVQAKIIEKYHLSNLPKAQQQAELKAQAEKPALVPAAEADL